MLYRAWRQGLERECGKCRVAKACVEVHLDCCTAVPCPACGLLGMLTHAGCSMSIHRTLSGACTCKSVAACAS